MPFVHTAGELPAQLMSEPEGLIQEQLCVLFPCSQMFLGLFPWVLVQFEPQPLAEAGRVHGSLCHSHGWAPRVPWCDRCADTTPPCATRWGPGH